MNIIQLKNSWIRYTLLKAYAGMDSMLFDAIADSDANGLVIEALWAGKSPTNGTSWVATLLG